MLKARVAVAEAVGGAVRTARPERAIAEFLALADQRHLPRRFGHGLRLALPELSFHHVVSAI